MGNGPRLLGNLSFKRSTMKKQHYLSLMLAIIFLTSCGISTAIRTASLSLVEKQKISLAAHTAFHKATIATITMYLDAELIRSKTVNDDAVKKFQEAMLGEIKRIYSNTNTSVVDKKVEEEKSRQKIMGFIAKAGERHQKRIALITSAKTNLLAASENLMLGEQSKTLAIEKMNEYLQAKRPSERLLNLINIDLNDYTKHVANANKTIEEAKKYMNLLKN